MLKHGEVIADTLGFMIAVDVVKGVDPESIMDKLGDALTWTEGVGSIDIDFMGELETIEGQQVTVNETATIMEGEFADESRMLNEGGKVNNES